MYRTQSKPEVRKKEPKGINWGLVGFASIFVATTGLAVLNMVVASRNAAALRTCASRGGTVRTTYVLNGGQLTPISTCEGATR
jgi:hypothetical protein